MALYAFDGTWNSAKEGDDPQYQNTNVVRFYRAYEKHSTTKDFYVAGVGTRFDLAGRIAGGLFGLGELARINEAYDHLCEQWDAGDRIIDIVGFSRGAATTLDFCHRIQTDGIRRPGSEAGRRAAAGDPVPRRMGRRRGVRHRQSRKHRTERRASPVDSASGPQLLLPCAGARRAPPVVSADPASGCVRSVVSRRAF